MELWFARLTVVAVAVPVVMVIMKAVDAAIKLWRKNLPPDGDRAFNDHFLILIGKAAKISIAIIAAFSVLGNLGFGHPGGPRVGVGSRPRPGTRGTGHRGEPVWSGRGVPRQALQDRGPGPHRRGGWHDRGDGTSLHPHSQCGRIPGDGAQQEVGTARIVNITRRPTIRACFGIGLTYDTPASRVRRATESSRRSLKSDPDTHDYLVHFNKFGDSSLNLDVVYWCRRNDHREFIKIFQRINLTIKERFDAEGLQFAFPTQTIQLETPVRTGLTSPSNPATTR